uniref:EF-hand domain-containing protein n=1 Tax=Eutreptiella gymnastica TaxID=73025 RepID=A0A7S1HT47_9EUGL|mmetsp:Transcript_104059/g.179274  ORF Transcript_104059/g.179274 Transcript_104059/m.179274 type:complete len:240 (+) Transcript_104059:74-793(+)
MALAEKDELLHVATSEGDYTAVERLLVQGAYADAEDEHGETCLYLASELGQYEMVRSLIKFGADVERTNANHDRNTALHVACLNGHVDIATYLIDSGAQVDAKNAQLHTPLHLACLHGRKVLANILIGRGAEIHSIDMDGQRPIDLMNVSHIPEDIERNIGRCVVSDRQLRHLFDSCDVNENGSISRREMHRLYDEYEQFGVVRTKWEIDETITKVTLRKDDRVTFQEFSILMLQLSKA